MNFFSVENNDQFYPHVVDNIVYELEPGIYNYKVSNIKGPYLQKIDFQEDNYVKDASSATERIITSIKSFWGKQDIYQNFGFLYKRGYLLYGEPGCGKSTTLRQVSHLIVDNKGIVVTLGKNNFGKFADFLSLLRKVVPDTFILVLIEDVDYFVDGEEDEEDFLDLLDGERQIDNVAYLMTTNYIENFPPRIINRPSRIDEIIEVSHPSRESVESFMRSKVGNKYYRYIDDLQGLSYAHLKEFIIAVECLGLNPKTSLQRLKNLDLSDSETE